ncbi:ATP-binding protein [Pelagicoccus sp. SDUM812005]|uniref:ATP-binding protein n=1 Tax=Pelagicoccus sp. SDUM812005 TaxID=3041257 RepID=UPI0028106802|nr:ATP-binding protein [Pelagicoccus sp. SDUM812005]MDQ8179374.1 ATP-binding protein [Pelagicoccus sp. SDUM812005]
MGKRLQAWASSLVSISVRKKFLLATKLSSLATLSLFGVAYVFHEKATFIEQKTEHLSSLSSIVASNSEASLIFDDPITAADYLNSLSSETDITLAALYKPDGSLFTSYQRTPSLKIPPAPETYGSILTPSSVSRVTKILVRQEHVGTLLIETDSRSLHAELRKAITIAVIIVALGTLFSVWIANLLQRLITRPLLELEQFAKQVAQDGNYSRRASKRFDDEIGSLAQSVNTMMEGVQERDRAISEHNRTLEDQVSTRTRELRTAMHKAEAASKAKSEFLSTMSHELRTPLNAIVGMSSVLASEKIDHELQNYVKIIQSSSDNLLAIINEILDYSKIESGHLELETAPFSLPDCLEEAIDMVAALHWEKQVDFFVTLDPSLPYTILGDITRLRQVVVNLLGNAAKFTRTGYVWLEAKYASTDDDVPSSTLSIAVHDTGIGIPQDRLDRLFQAFSQVDSTTTRQYGGTGLGLAISQKLVKAMGGDIAVRSVEGKGTTFSFELSLANAPAETIAARLAPDPLPIDRSLSVQVPFTPLKESLEALGKRWGLKLVTPEERPDFSIGSRFNNFEEQKPVPAKLASLTIQHPLKRNADSQGIYSNCPFRLSEARNFIAQAIGSPPKVTKNKARHQQQQQADRLPSKCTRILLAEDNKVNQKVFKLIMKREGFAVDIANDGQEAVAAVLKKPYDIIFMDLQMPKMDGLEACRIIRANDEIDQPWIIGFTANVESDAEPAMRAAGMNDFLSKPVKDERVRQALYDYKAQNAFAL